MSLPRRPSCSIYLAPVLFPPTISQGCSAFRSKCLFSLYTVFPHHLQNSCLIQDTKTFRCLLLDTFPSCSLYPRGLELLAPLAESLDVLLIPLLAPLLLSKALLTGHPMARPFSRSSPSTPNARHHHHPPYPRHRLGPPLWPPPPPPCVSCSVSQRLLKDQSFRLWPLKLPGSPGPS